MTPQLKTPGAAGPTLLSRLSRNTRGVALVEFALTLPLLAITCLGGLEVANYVIVHTKVSQIALAVADNAARVNNGTGLAVPQVRESDIVEVFEGSALQGADLDLIPKSRIILSSLEQNADGGQWIHWQRCYGDKDIDSQYGDEGEGATGTSFPGMGDPGAEVTASPGTAVMFVEMHYDYTPVIIGRFVPDRTIEYKAAYNIREARDLSGLAPGGPVASCA